ERSIFRRGDSRDARVEAGSSESQRERRRGRARPSYWGERRARSGDAALRIATPQPKPRHRGAVPWRRKCRRTRRRTLLVLGFGRLAFLPVCVCFGWAGFFPPASAPETLPTAVDNGDGHDEQACVGGPFVQAVEGNIHGFAAGTARLFILSESLDVEFLRHGLFEHGFGGLQVPSVDQKLDAAD